MMKTIKSAGLLLVALLSLSVAGLALPSINIRVQEIGEGSQWLVSPVLQGSIWFSPGLTRGELVFPENLSAGTRIYVSLLDSQGNVLAYNYSISLTQGLKAGSVLRYGLINPNGAGRSDVVKAVVSLITPDYQTTFSSGSILIESRELGMGIANTTTFCTPITITENSGHNLYNYSVLIVLDDSSNNNNEDWTVDWNVINSTNLYFTDESGAPLYFWIQSMDTSNRIAYLWVKIPELTASSSRTVCLNYGVWPNHYLSYNDPDRVFLLFDDFEGASLNTTKWNAHGAPAVSNSELSLSSGQWVWSKKKIAGNSFQILIQSVRLRPSPFFMWYVDSKSLAWAEVFNGSYWSGFDELDVFNVSSGKWGASYSGNGNPTLDTNNLITITVQPYSSDTTLVSIYEDSNLISQYHVEKEGDEPIGIGQWYYYNRRGRARSRASTYDWILVRTYVESEPSVSVGLWYYKLIFYPHPPASSTVSPATTLSLRTSSPSHQELNDIMPVSKGAVPGLIFWENQPKSPRLIKKNNKGGKENKVTALHDYSCCR